MRLFSKTYINDFEWLKLAIKTVWHFSKEEVKWTFVIEDENLEQLRDLVLKTPSDGSKGFGVGSIQFSFHGLNELWPEAKQISQGYLRQQWIKMNAHRVMGNDFFMNWDSDVIAVRPFIIDYFKGRSGRPIHWFTDYNHMIMTERDPTAVTAYQSRRALAGKIYGWPISFEWMRCMPMPGFGEILRCGAGTQYWSHMFELCKSATPGFSEFNFIGEYAHKFFPDAFEWRNAENSGPTWSTGYITKSEDLPIEFQSHGIVCQGWSYGGIPPNLKKWVDAL